MRYIGITANSSLVLELSMRPREDQWKFLVGETDGREMSVLAARHEQWKRDQEWLLWRLVMHHPELAGMTPEQARTFIEDKLVEAAVNTAAEASISSGDSAPSIASSPSEGSGWPP